MKNHEERKCWETDLQAGGLKEKEKEKEKEKKIEEKEEIEECVVCHKKTKYLKNTPIDQRKYYVEGCGQLCENCFDAIYD